MEKVEKVEKGEKAEKGEKGEKGRGEKGGRRRKAEGGKEGGILTEVHGEKTTKSTHIIISDCLQTPEATPPIMNHGLRTVCPPLQLLPAS